MILKTKLQTVKNTFAAHGSFAFLPKATKPTLNIIR